MSIKILEIEFGTKNPEKSKHFYEVILGVEPTINQSELKVFNLKDNAVDFNLSTHLPPQHMCTTFITDQLDELMTRLNAAQIDFSPPKPSHLGMLTIQLRDPDGYLIRINQATAESPVWLRNSI